MKMIAPLQGEGAFVHETMVFSGAKATIENIFGVFRRQAFRKGMV
jgi:hypothetical protein